MFLLQGRGGVLSGFAQTGQTSVQSPVFSRSGKLPEKGKGEKWSRSIASLMTRVANAVKPSRTTDIRNAVQTWDKHTLKPGETDVWDRQSAYDAVDALKTFEPGFALLFAHDPQGNAAHQRLQADQAALLVDALMFEANDQRFTAQQFLDSVAALFHDTPHTLLAALQQEKVLTECDKTLCEHAILAALRLVQSQAGRNLIISVLKACNSHLVDNDLALGAAFKERLTLSYALRDFNCLYDNGGLTHAYDKIQKCPDEPHRCVPVLKKLLAAPESVNEGFEKTFTKDSKADSQRIRSTHAHQNHPITFSSDAFLLKSNLGQLEDRQNVANWLAQGAQWLQDARSSGFKRIFNRTPFHGFSRLPQELRLSKEQASGEKSGIRASADAVQLTGDLQTQATGLSRDSFHSAVSSQTLDGYQTLDSFHSLDSLQSVDSFHSLDDSQNHNQTDTRDVEEGIVSFPLTDPVNTGALDRGVPALLEPVVGAATQKMPEYEPSAQLKKVFHLIDNLRSADQITLRNGAFYGVNTSGLLSPLSALSGFVGNVGPNIGYGHSHGRHFGLYMNESWLEIQLGTVAGREAEAGVSATIGGSEIGPLKANFGATLRFDPLVWKKEKFKGICIRIPCDMGSLPPTQGYDKRVNDAKQIAKSLLEMLDKAGKYEGAVRLDGHDILNELASNPLYADVTIDRLDHSVRRSIGSRVSVGLAASLRCTRLLFAGATARLKFDCFWNQSVKHEDPVLKFQKNARSIAINPELGGGLIAGHGSAATAPLYALASLPGTTAKDEEVIQVRTVDDKISPWSFREIIFSDVSAIGTFIDQWSALNANRQGRTEDEKRDFDLWRDRIDAHIKKMGNPETQEGVLSPQFDYVYAARFRLTKQAAERIDVLNVRMSLIKSRLNQIRLRSNTLADQSVSDASSNHENHRASLLLARLRSLESQKSRMLESIDSFGVPALYAYQTASAEQNTGVRMTAAWFNRNSVFRLDMSKLFRNVDDRPVASSVASDPNTLQ